MIFSLILIFALIYLMYLTKFIFEPIVDYVTAIAVPIIGAGIIYYITNPVVNWLEKKKITRIGGTVIVFLIIIGAITISFIFIAPTVQVQFSNMIDNIPKMVDNAQGLWQDNQNIIPEQFEDTIENITNNLGSYAESIATSIISTLGTVFSFIFSFFLIPFFLFFMLKDGHKFVPFITQFMNSHRAKSFNKLTASVNATLASFIQGQFIVSVCVGAMLYLGYVLIGLDYSLSLALFGLVMNFIPFIGPFLSAVPAVVVGFFQEPIMAIWATLVMVIAQQIESSVISPNIMGKKLSMHPLTIITLILAAGAVIGFLGVLFVIPAYAVVKTMIAHFYHEWKIKHPEEDPDLL
ncbi:AI-2E family transporter [Gracilibacillus alcaliphilus]|uniref:AI-2E family transporter n=1 Tax=Gracilibacillus alcaliphilus TaxID=1401441 RepID=UPI001EF92126|nr:AI-2E family transporter [Gracilibacillus alcaliphilus]MBM7677266.1 putative PurR-regulated permease PerM [Gracilibacillus alcaliphilus]